jgi:hypothetical protein
MLSYAVGLVIVAGVVLLVFFLVLRLVSLSRIRNVNQLLRKGSNFCRSTRKVCQKQKEMKKKARAEK